MTIASGVPGVSVLRVIFVSGGGGVQDSNPMYVCVWGKSGNQLMWGSSSNVHKAGRSSRPVHADAEPEEVGQLSLFLVTVDLMGGLVL